MQMRAWLAVVVLCAMCASGCVTRELHITSEPSGAEVLINDTYRGTTPMTHRFVHYQTFIIRLEKEGFHPLCVEEPIASPAYQKPGVDFVAEALVPKRIVDRRELHYTLEPVEGPDDLEALLGRAADAKASVEEAARRRAERDAERKPMQAPLLPVREKVKEAENDAAEAPAPAPDDAAPAEDATAEDAPAVSDAPDATPAE